MILNRDKYAYKNNESDNMDEERKHKIIRFTICVLIILLILLLRSCTTVEKINNLVPTGNIDIYDITINNSCCDKVDCDCPCNNNTKDVFNDDDEPDVDPYEDINEALIYDKDGRYKNLTQLNIFTNPAYEFKSIIAPTSTNVYQFVVRNNNEFNMKYDILMTEDNKWDINMKYRLKLDGKYVKGDKNNWVTYEDLKLNDLKLTANSKNVYQLEWKWFESDNDTHVGEIGDEYSLKISFDGKEI